MPRPPRRVLVLACGNPSRGDDALGPALIARLGEWLKRAPRPEPTLDLELLEDFQLQIEHALDLQGRDQVVFVDAALSGPEPFDFAPVEPEPQLGICTHALSPGAVRRVYDLVVGGAAPDCRRLAIRGYRFDLGAGLSTRAEANLSAAIAYLLDWLAVSPP